MTPRLRRLAADHQLIVQSLADHPTIQLVSTEGTPPDRYVVSFELKGLAPAGAEGFEPSSTHHAEIFLPIDYPRRAPVCRMLTPVFHPNIDPQKICIGDHWSAGQSLPMLITRIAEMISYQSYNVKSPLNARAAAWAEQNPDNLPLDRRDFTC